MNRIPYPFKIAALSFNTNGDNTVIAAATGQTIYVYALAIDGATATAVSIKDGAGTIIDGPATVTHFERNMFPDMRPRYILTAGNALIINLGAGNSFGGAVWYSQIAV